jgi:hypothetical protein
VEDVIMEDVTMEDVTMEDVIMEDVATCEINKKTSCPYSIYRQYKLALNLSEKKQSASKCRKLYLPSYSSFLKPPIIASGKRQSARIYRELYLISCSSSLKY